MAPKTLRDLSGLGTQPPALHEAALVKIRVLGDDGKTVLPGKGPNDSVVRPDQLVRFDV